MAASSARAGTAAGRRSDARRASWPGTRAGSASGSARGAVHAVRVRASRLDAPGAVRVRERGVRAGRAVRLLGQVAWKGGVVGREAAQARERGMELAWRARGERERGVARRGRKRGRREGREEKKEKEKG